MPDFPVQIGEVEKIVRTVTFWKSLDRIDCEVQLIGKKETAVVEAAHVAFPFGFATPRFALEQLGSVTDPATDVQEAGNRDTFAIQHWAHVGNDTGWRHVGDGRRRRSFPSATFASSSGIRPTCPTRAHLLERAQQRLVDEFPGIPGRRFRLQLRAPGARRAQQAPMRGSVGNRPRRCSGSTCSRARARCPPSTSLLSVAPDNVVLVNLKRAEDGDGWIVRLYETAGRRVAARLTWGMQTPHKRRSDATDRRPAPGRQHPAHRDGQDHRIDDRAVRDPDDSREIVEIVDTQLLVTTTIPSRSTGHPMA